MKFSEIILAVTTEFATWVNKGRNFLQIVAIFKAYLLSGGKTLFPLLSGTTTS